MILASIMALISIPITATLASLVIFPVASLEKRLQWQDKSMEQWRKMGVVCPGERVPGISFLFGLINTTVNKTAAMLGAATIFHFLGHSMPVWFVLLAGGLVILLDLGRIRRFLGNSGVWTELGYLCGDVIGVTSGALLAFHWIA
jgi:hypothetical protein